ncbi:AAA family ATPase [Arthrobacter humicola]|uniref:AAA family ATPase n=1 Tax=Arthrobacter humicola TaxID=409291 RepID=UPI001FADC2C0|nr:AAA family ATPase [Arthrobacter humicola]MCI9869141.1 hypothetical protein [Arthrobacter humicola]
MTSKNKAVLALAIQKVAHKNAEEPERFGPLPFVTSLSDALTGMLARAPFGYQVNLSANPSAATINATIREALEDESTARVLYIIGHGLDDKNDLLIVGSDGSFSEPVNQWTREPSSLLQQQEAHLRTPTLFILDCCSAGTTIMQQLLHGAQGEPNSRWVIAAATSGQAAFNGRLSEAFVRVLARIAKGELDIESSWPHIPYMQLARELRHEIKHLTGYSAKQILRVTPVEMDDPGSFPFFDNPAYIPLSPGIQEPPRELVAFLDSTAFDQKHWRLRASGVEEASRSGDLVAAFTGRSPELRQIADFCQRTGPGLLLLTGSPGSGKSAILGQLVCNAHADLHLSTSHLWEDQREYLPGVVTSFAAVHARQQSIQDILQSLSDQLQLKPQISGPGELIQELAQLVVPPLLIIDALDEARIGGLSANGRPSHSDIVDSLLVPLTTSVRSDGKPVAFVIVGARRWVGGVRLAQRLTMPHTVIDLDRVPDDRLRAELQGFAERRLWAGGVQWSASQIATFSTALAARLAPSRGASEAPKLGSFLAVSLFIASVMSSFRHPQISQALLDLAATAPQDITELLQFDIERRPASEELQAVLSAVAVAKGSGAPLEIIRRLASAQGQVDLSIARCKDILSDELSFYLRTSADADGSVLYRLFHQEVTDALKSSGAHREVSLSVLLQAEPHSYDWSGAEPYLRRHAVEHAADVDALADTRIGNQSRALADIWSSAEFMMWATPSVARRYPPPRHSSQYGSWELYRRAPLSDEMTPSEVALLVAIQNAKASDEAADKLNDDLFLAQDELAYWPAWGMEPLAIRPATTEKFPVTVLSTNASVTAFNSDRTLKFTGDIRGQLVVETEDKSVEGRPPVLPSSIMSLGVLESIGSVAIGGYDGRLAIWDWVHNVVQDFPHLHRKRITGIVPLDQEHLIVTTDIEGWMRLWRVDTRELVHEQLLLNDVGLTALTASKINRNVFVAATDRSIQRWDLRSDWKRKGVLNGSVSTVTTLALTPDERMLVSGSADGSIRRWDLNNLVMVGDPIMDLVSSVRYLEVQSNGITIEAHDEDKNRLFLDLYPGESSETLIAAMGEPGLSVVLNDRTRRVLVVGGSRGGSCYKLGTGQQISTYWFNSCAVPSKTVAHRSDTKVPPTDFWSRQRYGGKFTAASPKGNHWVTGDHDGRLIWWSRVEGTISRFSGDAWEPSADLNVRDAITGIAGSGDLLVVGSRTKVGVWETDGSFSWVAEQAADATNRPLAWMGEDRCLYTSDGGELWAWFRETKENRLLWRTESGNEITSIYVDQSKPRIWLGDDGGFIHRIGASDLEAESLSARFSEHRVVSIGMLGGTSVVCVFADGVIALLDEYLRTILDKTATFVPCAAADISMDANTVVLLDGNGPLTMELRVS